MSCAFTQREWRREKSTIICLSVCLSPFLLGYHRRLSVKLRFFHMQMDVNCSSWECDAGARRPQAICKSRSLRNTYINNEEGISSTWQEKLIFHRLSSLSRRQMKREGERQRVIQREKRRNGERERERARRSRRSIVFTSLFLSVDFSLRTSSTIHDQATLAKHFTCLSIWVRRGCLKISDDRIARWIRSEQRGISFFSRSCSSIVVTLDESLSSYISWHIVANRRTCQRCAKPFTTSLARFASTAGGINLICPSTRLLCFAWLRVRSRLIRPTSVRIPQREPNGSVVEIKNICSIFSFCLSLCLLHQFIVEPDVSFLQIPSSSLSLQVMTDTHTDTCPNNSPRASSSFVCLRASEKMIDEVVRFDHPR